MEVDGDRIVGPDALGDFLGVDARTLANWRYLKRGPRYVRVGKYVRYRMTDVQAWLEENAHEPSRSA